MPATTTLRFSSNVPVPENLTIPKGTGCRATFENGDHLDFTTITPVIIPRGQCVVETPARQGLLREESFKADGTAFQTYQLYPKDIGQDTVQLEIEGSLWTQVPHW